MIKLKKISTVLFSVMFALSTIVGCSSSPSSTGSNPSSGGEPNKAQETAKGAVNLQFWDMVWGPPEYIDTAKKLVAQFNKEHPNIQVTYQSTPWNNWYQTFSTAIASGTAPDISTGGGFQAFQFYDQDAILPIDDVVEEWRKEGKLEDFFPGAVETLKYDGHYVALPWALDIRVPWYNKELFEKAGVDVPKNWAEFREAAKKLSNGKGQYGMVAPSDTGGTQYLYTLMLNNGGGIFTPDRKVEFSNERNMEAIQFFADMVADGSVNPNGSGFKGDDAIKSFGQGDAAIIIRNPGFRSHLPEMMDKIGMMEPLEGPHGDKGTIMWVNNLMIYKQSKHPEEAKVFMKWWSENNLPLWSEGHSNQLSARVSFSKDAFFQNNPDTKQVYDQWVPVGKTLAARSEGAFPALNEIEGEGVMQTMMQELIMGKDPKATLDKAEAKIKQIVKE
ncbi:sugar ABC transporter substrate-binding protein [Ammoniphilus sp. YIM 78166]|uniref:ABC transporter substrate-binding protein n=1 Tax=Ammoniphilus sp. YIM 78166 TaxID=1644106 RepID=UPI001F0F7F08|nr:sugar ABC transporter substrate-binding protein [Ammoniphilus sp. YIM 78166]